MPVPSIEYETARVYAGMLWTERQRGNVEAAKAHWQEFLKSIELVIGAANATPRTQAECG
jgi:hypothetical protein